MRSALLSGREHTALGAIDVIAEGPCAIAISRGGAPKTYSHTEPNEDACGFAWGPGGVMIAVADGHHGAMGAEIALRNLLERRAGIWTDEAPVTGEALQAQASEAVRDINTAILDEAARCKLPPSPTTLCFAVIRPAEGLFVHASVGDSHIFWTKSGTPRDLGWGAHGAGSPAYVGTGAALDVEGKCHVASEMLTGSRSIVLVTDGFSETGIGHAAPASELESIQERTLNQVEALRPVETCRGVAESAIAIQRKNRAGDNLGCAVWTAPAPRRP